MRRTASHHRCFSCYVVHLLASSTDRTTGLQTQTTGMMSQLDPPQPSPKWTHTAEELLELVECAVVASRRVEDRIAALKHNECDFESVFLALAHAEARRTTIIEPLTFLQNVSPSQALRDAASKAQGIIDNFKIESSMRIDVFRAKQSAQENTKRLGTSLTSEEQRLVDKMMLDGSRAGLALSDNEREKVTKLKKELAQTCAEFNNNCNEERGVISFTREELEGVPEDVISGYSKRSQNGAEIYDVTFQWLDITPLLKFAENPETRRVAYCGFENRLAVNAPVMSRILALRRRIATILGYPTWADYVTEVKMAKTAKGVEKFLADTNRELRPIGLKDLETLRALKQKDHNEKGLPFDGEFWAWDHQYYERKYLEDSLILNEEQVKEYFPVSFVVPAILKIYRELLGVSFIEAEGETWHPDVQLYELWDKDASEASDFLGYFYLDIFPREAKYPQAAVWPILPGYNKPDGSRSYPVAVMVASLAKSTPDKPALMHHADVVTFFHEMGHLFHELLSQTRFSRFHGTTVAGDFMEAPSQMLENWCYEPKVLKRTSSHYQTGKSLSNELIEKIIKSRYVNVGLFYLIQVSWSMFDLRVHASQETLDYTKLWNELRESTALLKGSNLGAGQGALRALTGDYDVGLYGYLYSLVFAADMYATVFKDDPLDPARGALYRDKVLRPGSSKDEMGLLIDFLGREPNSEAFARQLFG
ncbi:Metalloprotease [Trametes maxima]|nr:Metalloprotease [Trametes maxima]